MYTISDIITAIDEHTCFRHSIDCMSDIHIECTSDGYVLYATTLDESFNHEIQESLYGIAAQEAYLLANSTSKRIATFNNVTHCHIFLNVYIYTRTFILDIADLKDKSILKSK